MLRFITFSIRHSFVRSFESYSDAILQTMTVKLTGCKEFTKDDRCSDVYRFGL